MYNITAPPKKCTKVLIKFILREFIIYFCIHILYHKLLKYDAYIIINYKNKIED